MPSFDIVREWKTPTSFRAQSVIGSFTLNDVKLQKHFIGQIPTELNDWQIGAVVGRSGSGKSTIAKELFPDHYIRGFEYKGDCILDDFPQDIPVNEITKALTNVGFSSPPDWLKRYDVLSQGEKMRVDMARALLLPQDTVVYDEFTSVIDRDVAKVASLAISKAVRRTDKRFIAVTCHSDIVDWLEPDWVFNTDQMQFFKKKEPTHRLTSQSVSVPQHFGGILGTITI